MKIKFKIQLSVQELTSIPYVSGTLYARIKVKNANRFTGETAKRRIADHSVLWNETFEFVCSIPKDETSGVLDSCICKISIRMATKGGMLYEKVGFVNIDLSNYAGCSSSEGKLLIQGYDSQRRRQMNSILKFSTVIKHISGDPVFKARSFYGKNIDSFLDRAEQSDNRLTDLKASERSYMDALLQEMSSGSGLSTEGTALRGGTYKEKGESYNFVHAVDVNASKAEGDKEKRMSAAGVEEDESDSSLENISLSETLSRRTSGSEDGDVNMNGLITESIQKESCEFKNGHIMDRHIGGLYDAVRSTRPSVNNTIDHILSDVDFALVASERQHSLQLYVGRDGVPTVQ
eukprot:Nk52_evm27s222 gene=Nk52_evmTU27s222